MDNLCLPVGDFLAFLDIMKPLIISAERIDDYIQIVFPRYTHMYHEEFGQVCHLMGIDNVTGEKFVHRRGADI